MTLPILSFERSQVVDFGWTKMTREQGQLNVTLYFIKKKIFI